MNELKRDILTSLQIVLGSGPDCQLHQFHLGRAIYLLDVLSLSEEVGQLDHTQTPRARLTDQHDVRPTHKPLS